MPNAAPIDIHSAVLTLLGRLKYAGYQTYRRSGHTVDVVAMGAIVTASVFYRHPRGWQGPKELVLRVTGSYRSYGKVQTVRATAPYGDDCVDVVRRVWDRVHDSMVAVGAVKAGSPESLAETVSRQINAVGVPMPRVTLGKDCVYVAYDHGQIRCTVDNIGRVAFALWNLR